MTDSSQETPQGAGSGARPGTEPSSPSSAARKVATRRFGALGIACVVLLLLVVALGGAAWYLYQQQQAQQADVLAQLQQATQASRQARSEVQALQTQSDMDQARLQMLESQLEAVRDQLEGLEQALQTLTANGGELALLNDIDQLVDIAQQQLTLGGNVANAIIALETAQARLARAALPSLAPLQQAINGDLERLRAVPAGDTGQLKVRLEELTRLVAQAPLLVRDLGVASQEPAHPGPSPRFVPAPVAPDAPWWEKAWVAARNAAGQGWALIRHDLGQFISVRRIDDPGALLISADQAGQLRENLRLRLMMAKLALMMRQNDIWLSEMQAVETLIQARYDLQTAEGKRALALAGQLAASNVAVALPDALNSRQVIQTLREARAQDEQTTSAPGLSAGAADTAADVDGQAEGSGHESGSPPSAGASVPDMSAEGVPAENAPTEEAPAAPIPAPTPQVMS